MTIALTCVLAHDPTQPRALERTLWRAACHAGDSDSTASIAGNLLGAMHGSATLPRGWLAQLELREVIERVAKDLFASAVQDEFLDKPAYPPN